jgi:hypothetical protein
MSTKQVTPGFIARARNLSSGQKVAPESLLSDSCGHRILSPFGVDWLSFVPCWVDRYLAAIPSMQKTMRAFHAKDDCPEVRKAVFECLDGLDFSVQVVVARKLETVFKAKHQQSQDFFYNDLTSHLFERQLHLASENTIIFAKRGDKAKQHALRASVEAGVAAFRQKYPNAVSTVVDVETAYSANEPLLQAADYALWSIQRAFERGEMRYFEYLRNKIELVWDVYDFAAMRAKCSVMYTRKNNPFHIEKASPLS